MVPFYEVSSSFFKKNSVYIPCQIPKNQQISAMSTSEREESSEFTSFPSVVITPNTVISFLMTVMILDLAFPCYKVLFHYLYISVGPLFLTKCKCSS